jgi:lambda repressor-like predicted transcriptional regulator
LRRFRFAALSIWPAPGWLSLPSKGQRCVRESADTSAVHRALTDRPFVEEVPRLLRERGLSIRALAREVGVTDGHLSRVLRRVNYNTPGPELARRVAIALGLPPDYFPEYRKGFVLERIRTDAVLCDELYAKVTGEKT